MLDTTSTQTLCSALAKAIAEHGAVCVWFGAVSFLILAGCYGAGIIVKAMKDK